MTFTPAPGRIWFEPIQKENIILSDKAEVIEAGKVLGIGKGVEDIEVGDCIFFLNWGAEETPEYEGKTYWTVKDDPNFIMGFMKHD